MEIFGGRVHYSVYHRSQGVSWVHLYPLLPILHVGTLPQHSTGQTSIGLMGTLKSLQEYKRQSFSVLVGMLQLVTSSGGIDVDSKKFLPQWKTQRYFWVKLVTCILVVIFLLACSMITPLTLFSLLLHPLLSIPLITCESCRVLPTHSLFSR